MKPVFSIFTPVYNSEKYIRKCIESVISQTIKDYEWYIYDDGSTDSSYTICREYAEKESRITLYQGKNGTSISEMNNFIHYAKGEYLVFIDNDDYWDKHYLEKMLSHLNETNADCAISSYTLVDYKDEKLGWYTPSLNDGEILNKTELKKRFLTTLEIEGFRWNKIYKRNVLINSNIYIENVFPADIRFEYALFDCVESVVLVNDKGYFYRQSSSSEVATVNIEKTKGMLETFRNIGTKGIEEGLVIEGKYYMSWRYISAMYLRLLDNKLSKDEIRYLFKEYSWNDFIGTSIFKALHFLNTYKNKREGRIKFCIKTIYVWINALRFGEERI